MRVIVVGAGGIARDLLRGLSDLWDATVVDVDPDRLKFVETVSAVETVEGDASSRLVLDKAGLSHADAFVAASHDDEVNLEACRLAIEAGIARLAAVATEPERLPDYREIGVPAFSPDRLTARRIETTLEPRRVSSAAFAEGLAEAIEIRITTDSPVAGKTLAALHSDVWLVATVLRDGALIVPRGDTVILADDLVTVVGAADDYSTIVRSFSRGEARFPNDLGKYVAVGLSGREDLETTVTEAINLTRNSAAEGLVMIHPEMDDEETETPITALLEEAASLAAGLEVIGRPVRGKLSPQRVAAAAKEGSVAVAVMHAPNSTSLRARLALSKLIRSMTESRKAILFSRGTTRYGRVLVPARGTPTGRVVARAAIDLAAFSKAILVGIAVIPPVFMARSDSRKAALKAFDQLNEEASVLDVHMQRELRQGNPARIIEDLAEPGLIVMAEPPKQRFAFRPSLVTHVIPRVPASVLLVPAPE